MTIKHSAPTSEQVQAALLTTSESRVIELLLGPRIDDSHYSHWEELRHRTPPVGMTHDEWWFVLKTQRRQLRRELPLVDALGNPFWFAYNDEVLRLSEEIARRTSVRSGSTHSHTTHANHRYLLQSLVEEAITSSQLEGASTSRKHAKHLLEAGLTPKDTSERMIVNSFLAMQEIAAHADRALSPERVLDLHRILTRDTLTDAAEVGRIQREGDERVSVVDQQERVTHRPPAAELLPERLERLCVFANGSVEEVPYLSPVIRAIVTHFMFSYDHYFADGNGRTARTAFYWSMLHSGYSLAEHVAISRILRQAPAQYGMAFEYSEDDEGDLTYFILHQLRTFKRALDEFELYLQKKLTNGYELRSTFHNSLSSFNARQVVLVEWLLREDVVTVLAAEITHKYSVTAQTARNDLRHLEQLGLLEVSAQRRPVVWNVPHDLSARLERLGSAG